MSMESPASGAPVSSLIAFGPLKPASSTSTRPGRTREPSRLPQPVAQRPGRPPGPGLAGGNVPHDSRRRPDTGASADLQMVGDAGAAAEHGPVADDHTARDAGIGREHAVSADSDVVGDLH